MPWKLFLWTRGVALHRQFYIAQYIHSEDPDLTFQRLGRIKRVCLHSKDRDLYGYHWADYPFSVLRRNCAWLIEFIDILRSPEAVEVMIQPFEVDRFFPESSEGFGTAGKHLRVLVTRLYRLVQRKPNLKICLQVHESDFQWVVKKKYGQEEDDTEVRVLEDEDPNCGEIEDEIEEPEREAEAAIEGKADSESEAEPESETETETDLKPPPISEAEVEDFVNGTSPFLIGLKSIELTHITQHPGLSEELECADELMPWDVNSIHWLSALWQTVFAREWHANWEKGIDKPKDEAGYAAVNI